MDPQLQRRIQQLHQMARAGAFGEVVRADAKAYDRVGHSPIGVFLAVVNDFYGGETRQSDQTIEQFTDLFCQLLIVVYREAKGADPTVAEALLHAFLRDYPGAPDTCVYPQLEALVNAGHAFKSSLPTSNRVLVWEQTLRLAQAYNEFLNVLLGYYLIAWRTKLGKQTSVRALYNPYGMKVNEFRELTGDDGPFYLLLRLARPHLRNAIAHGDVWLDSESDTVRFTEGKDQRTPYEMPLAELIVLNGVASHLPMAYLAAVATIAVKEAGATDDIVKLPPHLVDLFHSSR